MIKKPQRRAERVEVVYSDERWRLLEKFRKEALEIMVPLQTSNLFCIVHGSIARGDVSSRSDVDVFVPDPPSSFMVESTLEGAGLRINSRFLVQATPSYAAKGYVGLDEQRVVSFPLMKLRPVERDFYRFGGEATVEMLKGNRRVPGVDKRLMLIEPTAQGHIESAVVGREETVARLLNVSVRTVLDRTRALIRRDEVGRTGVFVERELGPDETFEMVLKKLAYENPAVRRRLRQSWETK